MKQTYIGSDYKLASSWKCEEDQSQVEAQFHSVKDTQVFF